MPRHSGLWPERSYGPQDRNLFRSG